MHANNVSPTRETLIKMLTFAMLEIRATESLKEAKLIADLFHNLPALLQPEWKTEIGRSAYDQILRRARRRGVERFVIDLKSAAEKAQSNSG